MTNSTLLEDVQILDGSGKDPYRGRVLVTDNRITKIATNDQVLKADKVIDGGGRTLMPGLCDAHLHITWNDQASLEEITLMPPEEHLIHSINVAKKVLLAGITSGVGAAAARPRFDCVLRNAINAGDIIGPRYLANTQEITTSGGLGDTSPVHVDIQDLSFGWRVSGPEEMRKAVRMFIKYGVDLIKLNLSGEEITGLPAQKSPMSDEEVAMAISEISRYGIRACAHARSAESVRQCLNHGVQIIYHASYADEESIDELARRKDEFFVGPGLAWLQQTSEGAADYGIPPDCELAKIYAHELQVAVEGLKAMHEKGVRVVPGGDYGFAWIPHGTNARDLELFVDLVGMTPMEAIVSATKLGGEIMGQADELGIIAENYLADLLLIDGEPLNDISILQAQDKISMVMKDGVIYR